MTRPPIDAALWSAVAAVLAQRPPSTAGAAPATALAQALAQGRATALPAQAEADALLAIGNAMLAARRADLADGVLGYAIRRAPHDPRLHNALGVTYAHSLRHRQAADAFARARELAPNWTKPLVNEAEVRGLLDDNDAAERLWQELARRAPGDARAAVGLAAVLGQRGDPAAAYDLATKAVAADPSNPHAWQVVGWNAQWAWKHEDALTAFERMRELAPRSVTVWLGIGSALLSLGRWQEGFEALEHRRYGVHSAPRFADVRTWDGSALDGTLVAHADQGYGDMIMQARYLADIRARVKRLVLLLDGYGAALAPLLARVDGVDRVAVRAEELASEEIAACTSLTSLLFHARATPPFATGRIPYVSPSEAQRARFAALASSPRPRIGVAWSVASREEVPFVTIHKSVPASIVADWMRATPDADWHAMQPGVDGDPSRHGLDATRLCYHGAELVDFDATAALASTMDLVVTADTSVAHLAGALGRPVWLVERANGCWRWRVEPHDWYPSIRVFRQQRMRDWTGAAREVGSALRRFLDGGAGR